MDGHYLCKLSVKSRRRLCLEIGVITWTAMEPWIQVTSYFQNLHEVSYSAGIAIKVMKGLAGCADMFRFLGSVNRYGNDAWHRESTYGVHLWTINNNTKRCCTLPCLDCFLDLVRYQNYGCLYPRWSWPLFVLYGHVTPFFAYTVASLNILCSEVRPSSITATY